MAIADSEGSFSEKVEGTLLDTHSRCRTSVLPRKARRVDINLRPRGWSFQQAYLAILALFMVRYLTTLQMREIPEEAKPKWDARTDMHAQTRLLEPSDSIVKGVRTI